LSQFSQENHRFIFISDDIGYVKEHFGSFKNVYYSSQNEITDFQLMMYADICVTANSTFSWWGAWLNEKPTKKIYVPKYFMGISDKTEFPSQIIPKNWIQVDVSI
jgi:hypothetical protein